MENKTVNIVYESICRFGEEETREMKQSYEQTNQWGQKIISQ